MGDYYNYGISFAELLRLFLFLQGWMIVGVFITRALYLYPEGKEVSVSGVVLMSFTWPVFLAHSVWTLLSDLPGNASKKKSNQR